MSLNELSNSDIVTLYLLNKSRLERYNTIIETKLITEELMIQDNVVMSAHYRLDDEKIEKLLESRHYKFLVDLDSKLLPIASIIEEVDNDLYTKITNSLNETI